MQLTGASGSTALWGVVLLVLVGCGQDDYVDPPPPTVAADAVPLPRAPVSVINVPMGIPLGPLLALVESAIPLRFGSLEEFHETPDSGRARVAFELERAPFQAAFVGDVARLSTTVLYSVRVQYALPALPDVETSCGMNDDPRPALSVAIESRMSLNADWSLRSQARVVELRPGSTLEADRCTVTAVSIDITDRVVEGARAFLEASLPRIDSLVSAVDTKQSFTSWWRTLEEPIELSDSLWLAMGPESVQRGPLRGSGDSVTVELGLRSRPRIVFGSRPTPTFVPLPPLDSGTVVPHLDLLVDARAEYGAAGAFLEEQLAGRSIDMGGRSIQVDSVQVYGIGSSRVAMRLSVSGDLRGRLYLTGRPSIDVATGQISVPDLDLDVATRDILFSAASWFVVPALRDYLREHATWPTAPAVDWLTTWLERGLNRSLSDDLRVTGSVSSVEILGATALQDALWVRLAARGSASMFVEN